MIFEDNNCFHPRISFEMQIALLINLNNICYIRDFQEGCSEVMAGMLNNYLVGADSRDRSMTALTMANSLSRRGKSRIFIQYRPHPPASIVTPA